MKTLRKFCAVLVLTLACALSGFAGDISAPGVTSQTQQTTKSSPISEAEACSIGDISAPGVTLDPLTTITLSLFEGLLSLF